MTEPDPPARPPAPERPSRDTRTRRRVARVVALVAVLVLLVAGFRLGFVDINDHPGLVALVVAGIVVFVIAFPFVGFRDASPGNRRVDGK